MARRAGHWLFAAAMAGAVVACARAVTPEAPAPPSATPVAGMRLPPPPQGPAMLRVTITPRPLKAAWPALLHARLRVDAPGQSAAALAPWSLFPPDQPATFSVRVPPSLMAAGRTGHPLLLTVTATPLNPVPPGAVAPAFDVSVSWAAAPD